MLKKTTQNKREIIYLKWEHNQSFFRAKKNILKKPQAFLIKKGNQHKLHASKSIPNEKWKSKQRRIEQYGVDSILTAQWAGVSVCQDREF